MHELMNRNPGAHQRLQGTHYKKQIIKFGKYRHPNPLFRDDDDAQLEFDAAMGRKLVKNFESGVVESVKFLSLHDEDTADKLGVITDLEVTKDGVIATFDVEDEKAIKQIDTITGDGKSLAHGVSVGLDFEFPLADASASPKKSHVDGPVLRHVASATIPWIQGMADWERVEEKFAASNSQFNFGHDKYTGTPYELETSEGGKGMKTALRKALEVMASNAGQTVEEYSEAQSIDLDDEGEPVQKKKVKAASKSKGVLQGDVLAQIQALLANSGDDDDEEDDDEPKPSKKKAAAATGIDKSELEALVSASVSPLAQGLLELSNAMKQGNEAINSTRDRQNKEDATRAVNELISQGKIIPAQREHYINLHVKDSDLFKQLTGSLQKVVEFDDPDENDGSDPFMSNPMKVNFSNEERDKHVERYVEMITPTDAAGKRDRVSGFGHAKD